MDYKATLLLPKTDFPMRAELPKREPALLAKWRAEDVYGQILKAREGAAENRETTFILHDGPPFANGDAHMGHALNMVLKDMVLKVQNMSGHYAPFVPGWDCHGLPIEHKVMKDLGATETDPMTIRAKCEETARHFVGVQSEQFQRLGIFGDWAHPYLTMAPAYEAETLRVFATLVGKDLVYQGLRPVLWSTGCQTALAEAEIEYKEKVDPAIYVKFPLTAEAQQKFPELMDAALLIWTTTPWTLPANLAVAVAPGLDYGVFEIGGEKILLHTGLVEKLPEGEGGGSHGGLQRAEETAGDETTPHELQQLPEGGREPAELNLSQAQDDGSRGPRLIAGPWKGSELAALGLTYEHPFLKDGRTREVFTADFVTADAGTGLVHIAPGHGYDDYQLGQAHGLPIMAPVDDRGCLTAEAGVPELTGVYVFKANPIIIKMLEERNLLFAQEEYRHDYPHCWRSKTPIVYRAVKQWFIKVDAFRGEALEAIAGVTFVPESGRNRIRGAVESRPDWCISRQRTWGVPLPVFYGEGGQPLMSEKSVRAFADLVEREGGGIWFSKTADELATALNLPLGLKKGRDTLDVWIDSGTSWAAVLQKRPELRFPADLYLEGTDQHRGWFQSSLLTAVAARSEAPYRALLTHGFLVDMEGKKLSKSGTGYQKPVDLMTLLNEHGADVVRLWIASQDFSGEIPFSTAIFARVADAYRSIRNTLRILLGNLADFDAGKNVVPRESWTELDLYIEGRFDGLAESVKDYYRSYQFSQVYQEINRFCTLDLSALYIDALKDRMYCDAKESVRRRSAQTVMHEILTGLIKLLAPILPFTAEEAWGFLGQETSVHLELFPVRQAELGAVTLWGDLLKLRDAVNERLEEARREKLIGKSSEARVEIATGIPALTEKKISTEDLEELFIVSQVKVIATTGQDQVRVTKAEDAGMKKCVRCWKFWDELGSDPAHPELCERCTGVVLGLG